VWWLLLALVLAVARLPTFQLWGDVRYTLGVERTTARTGWAPCEVWAHRPLLNRVLVAALDGVTVGAHREQHLLLISALLCGLAAWALHVRLRRRLGGLESAGLSAALLAGLVWAPPSTVLQPEWYALLPAVGAIAAAASPRRRSTAAEWRVAAVTGLLLSLTVLMKWTTAGTAATAWVAITIWCWPHHRQRLRRITVASVVLLPALLALQVVLVPHEGQWLLEMPALNPDPGSLVLCPPLQVPDAECGLQAMLLNTHLTSPLLLLLPGAVILLAGASRGQRRVAAVVVPAVGVLAALAAAVVQAQWFSNHYAAAPVLAAAWTGWAVARWWTVTGRLPWSLLASAAVVGLVTGWLLTLPSEVRSSPRRSWLGWTPGQLVLALCVAVLVGTALLCGRAVLGLRAHRRRGAPPSRAVAVAVAAAALGLGLSAPLLPHAAYAWNHGIDGKTAVGERARQVRDAASGDQIRAAIGPDTPVVYLAFGERSYWVGNPTYCRYAAATFLHRSVYVPTSQLRSFAENLDCLSDQRAAFAVVELDTLKLRRVDPAVRQRLAEHFDCDHPTYQAARVAVCPRRR